MVVKSFSYTQRALNLDAFAMTARYCLVFVACIAPVVTTGCSGSKGPATAKVSGLVTYKGSPVEDATVVFAPAAGGRASTAVTDAQGRYELSTFGTKDGAPPGEFKVSVTKTKTEGEAPNLTQEQVNEMMQRGETVPGPVTTNLLPEKYTSPDTSGLSKTVKNGENDLPLELTD
jgi:hypothetical protein